MKIVIVSAFDTYEQRVLLLRDFFLDNGYKVVVFSSDFHHMEKSRRKEIPEHFDLIRTMPYRRNISFQRLYSHRDFARKILKKLNTEKADLVWMLFPPNSLVNISAKYKRKNKNAKIVLDAIDMWPEAMPIANPAITKALKPWKLVRSKYLNEADLIVTECERYQEILCDECDQEKMINIYLAQTEEMISSTPETPDDRFELCYLGSVNSIIDIDKIAEILQNLPKKKKNPLLHIIGTGEKIDDFIKTAEEAGAEVSFHGKVYDIKEKQMIFDRCHFGINVMKDEVYVGLTMKSMDYFRGGLPLINNIKGDTERLVNEYNMGINYKGPESLDYETIMKAQENRGNIQSVYMEMFTREAFYKKTREAVDRLTIGGQ